MTSESSRSGVVLELAEEFLGRYRDGERPSLKEYIDRRPDLAAEIREVFPAMAMMEKIAIADESLAPASGGRQPPGALQQVGDYRIIREIGHGGMGIVYEAEQVSLGRHVALKVLPQKMLLDDRSKRRFEREAKAAARLHHTNIVPVFGVGEHDGMPYYVMQFIQGLGLDLVLVELRRLRPGPRAVTTPPPAGATVSAADVARSLLTGTVRAGEAAPGEPTPPPPAGGSSVQLPGQKDPSSLAQSGRAYWQSVARIGIQVADALAYAHSQGITHRDIKPSNLLLDPLGIVWVTDFGLAKSSDGGDLTTAGEVVGTLRYIPPERFGGHSDASGDVYSLGLTLYELLVLRPAFDGEEKHHLIERILNEEPARPSRLDPSVPRDLETIVLKASAKEPARRYRTATELADDLRRFVEDRPIRARRTSLRERLWRWCRRNPALAATSGAAAAALLAVAVVSTVLAVRVAAARDSALDAQRAAEAQAEENRKQVGRQYVANGLRLLDEGDLSGALLWFAEALKQDENDPDRAELHRLRLGTLRRECPRPEHVWFHDGKVNDAAWSPDGRWIVTGGDDRTAHLWDAASGERVGSPMTHEQPVRKVKFSSDGKRLLTLSGAAGEGAPDKKPTWEVRVWETPTGRAATPPLRTVLNFTDPSGLPGQSVRVGEPAFNRAGSRLFTVVDDRTVQVWDAATGQSVGPPLNDRLNVQGVVWHPNGARLLVIRTDLPPGPSGLAPPDTPRVELTLFDADKGQPVLPPWKLRANWPFAEFSADGRQLLCYSHEGVRVWDAETGRLAWSYARTGVGPAEFVAGGAHVLVHYQDEFSNFRGVATVLDAATGRALGQSFTANVIDGEAFSPDGSRLALLDQEKALRIWETATGRPLSSLKHETANSRKFSPDSRRVLTIGVDNAVRLWEAVSGTPLTPVLKHEGPVSDAAFSPDGRHVLTVSGGTVRVWPLRVETVAAVSLRPKGRTLQAWFSPDDRRIVTLSGEGNFYAVTLWDAAAGQAFPLDLPAENSGYNAAFSPDGRWLVTWSAGGPFAASPATSDVRVWEAAAARLVARLACEPGCTQAVFSRDGRRLVTAHDNGTARIWDAATGQPVTPVLRHPAGGTTLAGFSDDGRLLSTFNAYSMPSGVFSEVQVWDETGRPLLDHPIRPRDRPIPAVAGGQDNTTSVEFSPDGGRLLIGMGDNTCRVWDARTGAPVTPVIGVPGMPNYDVKVGRFSADGRRLLTCGGEWRKNGQARVWDAATGEPLTPPMVHEVTVKQAEFSPDGRRIATASEDWTARVWDAATGEPLTPPLKHAGAVWQASFSADGRRVHTQSLRGDNAGVLDRWEVRVWDAETGQPLTPPLLTLMSGGVGRDNARVFRRDGRSVLLGLADGSLEICDLTGERRPAAEVVAETQVLSGRRVNDTGSVMPLEADRLRAGWARVTDAGRAPPALAWHRQEAEACVGSVDLFGGIAVGLEVKDAAAAVWHLDCLLRADPDDRAARKLRGRAYAVLGRWQEALADYDILLASGTEDGLWYERGVIRALLGHWQRAAEDLGRAVRVKEPTADVLAAHALVSLRGGDRDGYRASCTRLLEWSGETTWLMSGLTVVRVCSAGPEAVKDYAPLLGLVAKQTSLMGGTSAAEKAALLFRAGKKDQEALSLLADAVEDQLVTPPRDAFFLALMNHRLGRAQEARDALQRGVRRLDELRREREGEMAAAALRGWQERLEEELLRREAEETLGK